MFIIYLSLQDIPELVCYEKQSNWGGLWNYTWRTGSDQHGEPVHGSMYRWIHNQFMAVCTDRLHYRFMAVCTGRLYNHFMTVCTGSYIIR